MATKTVTLTGAELRVNDLGGLNALVVNNTTDMLYASAKAGVVPYADGVIEIKAGETRTLLDTNGTVYLLGNNGRAEITGGVNFKQPSPSSGTSGGGGGDTMFPHTYGIVGLFASETFNGGERWENALNPDNFISITGTAEKNNFVCFSAGTYGRYDTNEPDIIYAVCRLSDTRPTGGICPVITKATATAAQRYGFNLLAGLGADEDMFFSGMGTETDLRQEEYKNTELNVYCFVREPDGRASFYINGAKIARTSLALYKSSYSGYYLLNSQNMNNTRPDIPWNVDYAAIAFGLAAQSEKHIIENSEWLVKKYLGGD